MGNLTLHCNLIIGFRNDKLGSHTQKKIVDVTKTSLYFKSLLFEAYSHIGVCSTIIYVFEQCLWIQMCTFDFEPKILFVLKGRGPSKFDIDPHSNSLTRTNCE